MRFSAVAFWIFLFAGSAGVVYGQDAVIEGEPTKVADVFEVPLVYGYDPTTGIYTGSAKASFSPLEGTYKTLRNTTWTRPPTPGKDEAAVFDPQTGTWSIVQDHRGKTIYAKGDGSKGEMDAVGPVPSGFTLKAPQSRWDRWREKEQAWSLDAAAKTAHEAERARVDALRKDASRAVLRDKLDTATPKEISDYVDGLFPNLTKPQREFLSGLLLLAR